jgi:hypothetical protein
MEALCINCLQAAEEGYDEAYHTEEKMDKDVAALYKMGQGVSQRKRIVYITGPVNSIL